MFATFAVSPTAGSTYTTSIRVKNGTTTIASLSNITYSGATFVVSPINVTKVMESTVKKSTPTFTWEISYDNGTSWLALGNSGPHTMYWTYATPLSPPYRNFNARGHTTDFPPLCDLALEKACGYANGNSILSTILSNINQGVDNDIFYAPGVFVAGHPLRHTSLLLAVYAAIWFLYFAA